MPAQDKHRLGGHAGRKGATMLTFNPSEVLFCKAESFLRIGARRETGRLVIGTARKRLFGDRDAPGAAHDFYEVALVQGDAEIPYTFTACPWRLDLLGPRLRRPAVPPCPRAAPCISRASCRRPCSSRCGKATVASRCAEFVA